MALTLNNFIGFETGGLEEASGLTGSMTVISDPVRTGNYALSGSASGLYEILPFESVADAGDKQIVGVAVYFHDITPAFNTIFLTAYEDGDDANALFHARLETSGSFRMNYVTGGDTMSAPFTQNKWHYLEIVWQHLDSATVDVYVDGSSIGSFSGKDLSRGGTFDGYQLYWSSYTDQVYDDFYCMSGATGVSDLLGPRVEVLGAFQNNVEDATDQGTTLDIGDWANSGSTPLYSVSLDPAYQGGAQTGYTRCDEGDRDGPLALITGTSKGAKWLHRLNRTNGSGTTHYKRYGAYDGASDQVLDAAVTLGTGYANFFTITETDAQVPSDTDEYFCSGIRKTTGGRFITANEIWAFLLHVQPDPATLDLTDMAFPDRNYYLGPFGT